MGAKLKAGMLTKAGKEKVAMNDQIQKLVKTSANKTPAGTRPKSSAKVDGIVKANVTKITVDKTKKKVANNPSVPNLKIGLVGAGAKGPSL